MELAARTLRGIGRRVAAMAAAAAMSLTVTACAFGPSPSPSTSSPAAVDGQSSAAAGTPTPTADAKPGSVAIFTPSDGITLSQNTPTNKWAALTKDIQQALNDGQGASQSAATAKPEIKTTSSSDLAAQSRAVQDYVVSRLSADDKDDGATTIIVAPVANPDATTRQYGDYVRQDVTWNANASTDESDEDRTRRESGERLADALTLARDSGMHVVLVSNQLQGFTPDLFVAFASPREIGRIQAQQLVRKLELDRTSADNPKYIEVLLPWAEKRKDGTEADSTFVSEAFAGIWEVLGPYFQNGKATSPSRILGPSSTEDSWQSVTFDPSQSDGTKIELAERLGTGNGQSSKIHRIDGVLAMNDYVAAQTVSALEDMGYTGSSADINPEISISDIVGSFAGKVDLQRGAVPDPIKAPSTTEPTASPSAGSGITLPFGNGGSSTSTDASDDPSWPIITGYGAYVDAIPQIVNGKQWMTALGNRKDTAALLAKAVASLNAGTGLDGLDGVSPVAYGSQATGNEADVPTIAKDQLPVAASNLKSILIDPGYITPADAGL